MKRHIYFIMLLFSCTTNGVNNDVVIKELLSSKPISRKYVSLKIGKGLDNIEYKELLERVDDEFTLKVLNHRTANKIFDLEIGDVLQVKYYDKTSSGTITYFHLIKKDYLYKVIVSFSEKGKILDYKCVRAMQLGNEQGKGFFGDIRGLKVFFIDSTEQMKHPEEAKTLVYDLWELNSKGLFIKK